MVVKYRFRLILFSLLVMVAFMTLVYRLYYLQIERNEEFKGKLPTTRHLKARVPGVRGEIKDRNGVVLVSNKPSFEVRINLKDVVDAKVRAMKIESHGKPVALPKVEYDKNEGGFARKMRETDIVAVMEEMVFEPLRKMKLAKEETDQERQRNQENLRTHFRTNGGAVPWVYRSDLTFEEFSRFAEHNLQLPGVFPEVRPTRQYIYDALACHVLGYVRLPDESLIPLSEQQKWKYAVWDDFGAAGVEKTMDSRLKGVPGVRVMLRNEKGNIVGEMPKEFVPPKKGNDVWLTLDARIQFIAETALRDANLGRAAAVVIDPNSGDVLAMASVPCYDPNKWVPKINDEDLKRYFTNPTNPMINRAIKKYAPGSTFKIATSFAGCLAHIQGSHFTCNGSVTYGNKAMKCWIADKGGSHGSIDLSDALMQSCNCYFYQYGNRAGIEAIGKAGHMLGVGEKTGIELDDEDPGVLPTREWLQLNKPNENWRSPGMTANTSIGQGFVEATPLQIASVAATVANAGKSYRPHLLKRVVNGVQVVEEKQPDVRADLAAEGIDPKDVEVIRRGMWKVVNGSAGTGKKGQVKGVEVAGKTGTAQFWRFANGVKSKDNHTWFTCFAPYNNPKFAICVMLQGGKSGGGCSAPVAQRILEQCLALEQGYQVTIVPTKEVEGNFNPTEQVTFGNSPVLAQNLAHDEDGDDGRQADARESPPDRTARDIQEESKPKTTKKSPPKAIPVRPAAVVPPKPPEPERRSLLQRLFR